ncbi:MAG: DNA polymerase domain-containing protein [Kiritimatiellia bacterium]|jgi:DNA polymerase elongation subunit (family B)|nr:DNA polymerase domain-containing protein [Kiritimatiellia bacterium]
MKPITRDELVYGFTPEPGLVALEHAPGADADAMTLFLRREGQLTTRQEPFRPYLWLTKSDWLTQFEPAPELTRLSGDNPYGWLARFPTWAALERALAHLRKTTGRTASDPAAPYFTLRDPVQQFLLDSGRTSFRDLLLPDLNFLFVDIETDCAPERDFSNADREEDRILAIALADGHGWEQLLDGHDLDEKAMLQAFVKIVRQRDPDILVGHNLFKFDLPYIETRAKRHRVALTLGRDGSKPQTHSSRFNAAERVVTYPRTHIYGRHVVDTYLLALIYDVSHRAMEGHSLKAVARHFGVAPPDRTYIEGRELASAFRKTPDAFRRYALDDIRETAAITPILLAAHHAQSQILPFPLETVCVRGNAAKIESLLLREYLRNHHSLPAPSPARSFEGGYTDLFYEGLARNVHHCDVRSLYPSILLRVGRSPRYDALGTFLRLLEHLRDFRIDAKQRAHDASLPPAAAAHWDALQTSFKILINSFYGYLGFSQARFNDYDLAAAVTADGRDLLRGMVDQLRALRAMPIEIDTDGIYFTPPSGLDDDGLAQFKEQFRAHLPEGIEVEFDGHYPAMFSYKMKNYALLEDDGTVIIKGAALKSRGLEPFLRDFLREWLTLTLQGRGEEIPAMVASRRDDIIHRRLPVTSLAKTEMLSDAPSTYLKKREAGGKSRQPSYEVALNSGRLFQSGDAVSYYVTGAKKNLPVHANAKLASLFDPNNRDENVLYYLGKLDALIKKLDAHAPESQTPDDDQPTLF